MTSGRWAIAVAVLFLVSMGVIEVTTARLESPIIDEGVHIAAGLSYWRTGDFRMNPEHPPLMKLLSTLPLVFTKAVVPTSDPTWQNWNEWEFGDAVLWHNVLSVSTIVFIARIPTMILSLLLGWWIFRASRELFGPWGGAFSLALYAFDPNIIAHSRYVTTDLGFTALTFLSIHRLVRLLQQPTRRNAVWFGLAFLAAGLMKFSGMVLLLVVIALLLMMKFVLRHHPALQWRTIWRWLRLALPIAALLIWGLYGFDIRRPAQDPRIHQLYSQRDQLLQTTDVTTLPPLEQFVVQRLGDRTRSIGAWLERMSQVPIPAYGFFRGFFAVIGHSIGGQESYLLGQYANRGWWYYFPVAFASKTSLPALIAIAATMMWAVVSIRRRQMKSMIGSSPAAIAWILYGGTAVLFFLISVMSNLNLGWRHIMPIYPLLYVLSGVLTTLPGIGRLARGWVPGLLAANVILVQIGTYPNELGYFNALVGGTRRGPTILLDSNLDWGQDLPKLNQYVQRRHLTALPFAYYGRAEVNVYVPAARRLPTTEEIRHGASVSGPVAISVGQLFRRDRAYDWLWAYTPETTVGSSIYLYELR